MTAPTPVGVVAHYNLLERLEPSGPGELYRARDTHRGRTVTLRLLPEGYAASHPGAIADVRALAGMSHQNLAAVFEVGEHDGRTYIASEFLRGTPLRSEMAGRLLNPRRALEVGVALADAVAELHAGGHAHGAITPDVVFVTDKGHAKLLASELGTPAAFAAYGAQEPGNGPADELSDIQAIGAVLYEMLTARRPNPRGASAPSASNRQVSPDLDAVVLKAIAPNPSSRWQSAVTLAAELRSAGAMLDAREAVLEEPAAAAGGVSRVVVAIVVLALAALLAWVMWS